MNKNLLILIPIIFNIFIFSVHAYTLKKYDYGQFFKVANGPVINKNYQVSKHQLLIFKLTKDEGDSVSTSFSITSKDAPENIIFYSIFSDEIANEKNSNKSVGITPLESFMCLPNVFSFSIQVDNTFLGGDLIISIKGNSDNSKCFRNSPVKKETNKLNYFSSSSSNKEIIIKSEDTIKLSNDEPVTLTHDDNLNVGQQQWYRQYSSASKSCTFANGILLLFSFVILLSL